MTPWTEGGKEMDLTVGIFAPDTHRPLVIRISAGGKRRERGIMAAGSEQQYARQRQRAAPDRQKGPTSPFDKTVHCHAVLLNCVFQSFT